MQEKTIELSKKLHVNGSCDQKKSVRTRLRLITAFTEDTQIIRRQQLASTFSGVMFLYTLLYFLYVHCLTIYNTVILQRSQGAQP